MLQYSAPQDSILTYFTFSESHLTTQLRTGSYTTGKLVLLGVTHFVNSPMGASLIGKAPGFGPGECRFESCVPNFWYPTIETHS